ncbi:hypothetical protein L208DRAFT_1198553, partial [Tricholoma matsutake]
PRLLEGVYLLDKKPMRLAAPLVIHNNFSNCMALGLPWFQWVMGNKGLIPEREPEKQL